MDRRKFLKAAGAAPAAIAVAPTAALAAGTRPFLDTQQLYRRNGNRSTVACQNGIVCASQPLATMVASMSSRRVEAASMQLSPPTLCWG